MPVRDFDCMEFNPNFYWPNSYNSLPVCQCKSEIIKRAKKYQNLSIICDTGSGKSTKVPQYLLSILSGDERIICTQPRRIAAISLAKRVSFELNCLPGELVGYMVRFDSELSPKTRLIYATDGSLLRESIKDPLLLKYSIIILDEAHERSIHTDVLFGIVKSAQRQRASKSCSPLKVVVMSATISLEKFASYFSAEVLYIEGRCFPINYFYLREKHSNYYFAAYSAISKLHRQHPLKDDFLVFLAGQDEIESLKLQLDSNFVNMRVFCLYSALPIYSQMDIFKSLPNARRVILSTNIAETSITIPGVKVVIDSGVAKVKTQDPLTGLISLQTEKISRSEARQRAGRVGRTSSGFCYRLYTEKEFYDEFREQPTPELLRSGLSTILLMLLESGIKEPQNFEWLDPPTEQTITSSWVELQNLSAIDSLHKITYPGTLMAHIPLDPRFSKALVLSANVFNCSVEIVTLLSILTEKHLLFIPSEKNRESVEAKRLKFLSEYGDILTYLNFYRAYIQFCKTCTDFSIQERRKAIHGWCNEYKINHNAMVNVKRIRIQLLDRMRYLGLPIISAVSKYHNPPIENRQILCTLLSAFFDSTARYSTQDRSYSLLLHKELVHIHPSSILHGSKYTLSKQRHDYILFIEKVFTTNNYVRHVSVLDRNWLDNIEVEDQIKAKLLSHIKTNEEISVVYS